MAGRRGSIPARLAVLCSAAACLVGGGAASLLQERTAQLESAQELTTFIDEGLCQGLDPYAACLCATSCMDCVSFGCAWMNPGKISLQFIAGASAIAPRARTSPHTHHSECKSTIMPMLRTASPVATPRAKLKRWLSPAHS